MAKTYQQKAISRFYDNREAIATQRAQELVTELYLTEGKKRAQNWKHLSTHLLKLGVKQPVIDNLIKQDKPELVANLLQKMID